MAKTKYLTAKPKTSRQKQNTSRQNRKPHSKNKIPHDKTKILTAKPKTSRQNQILHSKSQIPHAKANTHGKLKSKLFCFCCDVFGFAARFLVLPWGILFLPWGFWFCRDVFVFAVRFLVLPWQWSVIIKICTERIVQSAWHFLGGRSWAHAHSGMLLSPLERMYENRSNWAWSQVTKWGNKGKKKNKSKRGKKTCFKIGNK